MNLGGAVTWSIETDDFKGLCYGTPFILTKAIVSAMNGATTIMPNNPCISGILNGDDGQNVIDSKEDEILVSSHLHLRSPTYTSDCGYIYEYNSNFNYDSDTHSFFHDSKH